MSKGKGHIPQRTCVACRAVKPKAELVRMARGVDGELVTDTDQRLPGRGLYHCKNPDCRERCLKRGTRQGKKRRER